jgi:Domain of unknown function (DUF4406)
MRVYLSGPMQNIPFFNFPAFRAAATKLRGQGYEVFSPAERDIEQHGIDISDGNETGDIALAVKQCGFSIRDALADDCEYICRHADAIAMLPGWEHSKGAKAERALGIALGHSIIYLAGAPELVKA